MKLRYDFAALQQFCRAHGVARLELFGSVLRDDFRPDSDVDVLCTLQPGSDCTLLGWADMSFKLEAIFGRSVDLVSRPAGKDLKCPVVMARHNSLGGAVLPHRRNLGQNRRSEVLAFRTGDFAPLAAGKSTAKRQLCPTHREVVTARTSMNYTAPGQTGRQLDAAEPAGWPSLSLAPPTTGNRGGHRGCPHHRARQEGPRQPAPHPVGTGQNGTRARQKRMIADADHL